MKYIAVSFTIVLVVNHCLMNYQYWQIGIDAVGMLNLTVKSLKDPNGLEGKTKQ